MALTKIKTAGIADDAVTLDKMAGLTEDNIIVGDASGNPSIESGSTARSSLGLGGIATQSANSCTMYGLNSDVTGSANPITSWTIFPDTMGSSVLHSSGTFSFQQTGYWLIVVVANWAMAVNNGDSRYNHFTTMTTSNGSTYYERVHATAHLHNNLNNSSTHFTASSHLLFDVQTTGNYKVRFKTAVADGDAVVWASNFDGTATSVSPSNVTFLRLGDT